MTFYCNKRDNPKAPEGMECTHCYAVGSECPEWDPDTEWFTKEVKKAR